MSVLPNNAEFGPAESLPCRIVLLPKSGVVLSITHGTEQGNGADERRHA